MITNLRINEKGELEGKVEAPQWDEMYTKDQVVDILEDLRLDFQEAEIAGVVDNKELFFADEVDDLVQQKINELKGVEDGNVD